ncbi:PREDICTED: troponin T, fast skeletal muscle-like, partial [Buceros rhinoceros silvestris]|uniref:troponin T, fast skeletal muscle-like n=1 Tax=Buceros rhinoceros silvestris TaxID=175836 RepID=UPI0005281684
MEAKKDIKEEDEDKVQKNYEVEEEEVEDVEVEVDVKEYEEVEEDVEEEDEEQLEEDEKEMEDVDVEELKDEHGGKAPQHDSDGELDTPPLTGMRYTPGAPSQVPRQLGGMEASLQVLVSQLRTELGQQEAASRALAAQLAQEKRRHQHWEEDSAQWVQLQAREAEALRETNTFLEQALAAAVAAGDLGVLARAQEEAQSWQKAAEERDAQLARALAEAAALSSRLQDCQVALTAAGQMDALEDAGVPEEVAAVKEVLQRALEIARDSQDPSPGPQAEGELGTAVGMAMHLANLAAAAQEEAWQSRQQLQAQRQEMAQLQEQLSRARQDGERWASALQRAQRE